MGTFFKELRHATCRVWSSSTCGCSSLFAFCRPCLSLLRAKMFRVQSAHEIGAERGGASTRHRLPVHHRICGPDPECIFLRLPCWVPTLDALGVQKNAFGVTWFMARDEAFRVVSVNNVGRLETREFRCHVRRRPFPKGWRVLRIASRSADDAALRVHVIGRSPSARHVFRWSHGAMVCGAFMLTLIDHYLYYK
jgi:hypothetical protein